MILLILLLLISQGDGFDRNLGMLVPIDRIALPSKIDTKIYGIYISSMNSTIDPIRRNINSLTNILSKGAFDSEHKNTLYPLSQIKTTIIAHTNDIERNLKKLEKLEENVKRGQDISSTKEKTILLEHSDFFAELAFTEITHEIFQIVKIVNFKPSPPTQGSTPASSRRTTTSASVLPKTSNVTPAPVPVRNKREMVIDASYKDTPQFDQLVIAATIVNHDLGFFSKKLDRLVKTLQALRLGQASKLENEFFFKTQIEDSLKTDFTIIDIPYFSKSEDKFDIVFDVAKFSGISEFDRFFNIQYFGKKLARTYYSALDSEQFFELDCIHPMICYPRTSDCSRLLYNGTLLEILRTCPLIDSVSEFEILPGAGLIVNQEPENVEIKAFLDSNNISPRSYPFMVEIGKCIALDSGNIEICLHQERSLIHSKYQKAIFNYLNPMWYTNLHNHLKDISMVLFFAICLTIYVIIIMSLQKLQQLTRYLYKRLQTRFPKYLPALKSKKIQVQGTAIEKQPLTHELTDLTPSAPSIKPKPKPPCKRRDD